MILILLCILLFEVTKPWLITMATRTMIFFIGVKTMANFRKWTWKLGDNITCIGGGEIITDIKTGINLNTQKSFTGLLM